MENKRKYIGLRYVPIFKDWSKTESFEPLVNVLVDGKSYTSKTYVPVGIEITDKNYWVETGCSVSAIESEIKSKTGPLVDEKVTEEITILKSELPELLEDSITQIVSGEVANIVTPLANTVSKNYDELLVKNSTNAANIEATETRLNDVINENNTAINTSITNLYSTMTSSHSSINTLINNNTTKINSVASDVEELSANIANGVDAWTVSGTEWRVHKVGSVVVVNVAFLVGNCIKNTPVTIDFTIPEGYRPAKTLYSSSLLHYLNDIYADAVTILEPDGTMKFSANETLSKPMQVNFNFVYPV